MSSRQNNNGIDNNGDGPREENNKTTGLKNKNEQNKIIQQQMQSQQQQNLSFKQYQSLQNYGNMGTGNQQINNMSNGSYNNNNNNNPSNQIYNSQNPVQHYSSQHQHQHQHQQQKHQYQHQQQHQRHHQQQQQQQNLLTKSNKKSRRGKSEDLKDKDFTNISYTSLTKSQDSISNPNYNNNNNYNNYNSNNNNKQMFYNNMFTQWKCMMCSNYNESTLNACKKCSHSIPLCRDCQECKYFIEDTNGGGKCLFCDCEKSYHNPITTLDLSSIIRKANHQKSYINNQLNQQSQKNSSSLCLNPNCNKPKNLPHEYCSRECSFKHQTIMLNSNSSSHRPCRLAGCNIPSKDSYQYCTQMHGKIGQQLQKCKTKNCAKTVQYHIDHGTSKPREITDYCDKNCKSNNPILPIAANQSQCLRPNCDNFQNPGFDYCSKKCAILHQRNKKNQNLCGLAGCFKPCTPGHNYCSRKHGHIAEIVIQEEGFCKRKGCKRTPKIKMVKGTNKINILSNYCSPECAAASKR